MRILPGTILVFCAASLLTSCSAGPEETQPAPTPSAISTVTQQPTTAAPAPTPEPAPAPAPAPAAPAGPAGPYQAANPSQVGGTCAIGTSGVSVTASSDASCGFANAIFNSLQNVPWGLTNPNPAVTRLAQVHTTVTSPTTGKSYAMTCTAGSDQRSFWCEKSDESDNLKITCTAGNNSNFAANGIILNP